MQWVVVKPTKIGAEMTIHRKRYWEWRVYKIQVNGREKNKKDDDESSEQKTS
jgi:hypothetical protein